MPMYEPSCRLMAERRAVIDSAPQMRILRSSRPMTDALAKTMSFDPNFFIVYLFGG